MALAFSGRTIALCVTGSIAAYKSALLTRLLRKQGADVIAVMTASAAHFIGPSTLSGLTGHEVLRDVWDAPGELHIDLANRVDLIAVVPATADVLARLAQGRADDLVTALVLSSKGPVVVAPAMHPRMWLHPSTQRNVAQLVRDGRVTFIGPVEGQVASGEVGFGRMAEPEAIMAALVGAFTPRDLAGLHVVVTAGPTVEDLDPVRFLGNRSSGKMGFAVAERAALRGAEVTLIAGPVGLATPAGVRRVDVRGALAMRAALWEAMGPTLERADALVMAAAVADYRAAEISPVKIKKQGDRVMLKLVKNPDLLAEVGGARQGQRPVLIGFAVETGPRLLEYARQKLVKKRVDIVVANDASEAFGGDDNRAVLVTADKVDALETMSKAALADRILDLLGRRVHGHGHGQLG